MPETLTYGLVGKEDIAIRTTGDTAAFNVTLPDGTVVSLTRLQLDQLVAFAIVNLNLQQLQNLLLEILTANPSTNTKGRFYYFDGTDDVIRYMDGSSVLELVELAATQTLTNKTLTSPRVGTSILDTGGNEIIDTPATTSAVNQLLVRNAAATAAVAIESAGGDTNININIKPKGSGKLQYNGTEVSTVLTILGGYRVQNFIGKNNAATPNTKYDFTSADLVVLRNSTTGEIAVRVNPAAITVDLGVVGANGIDTGTQAASTWYHFYYIWNGTTLAGIASTTAPTTGPALPTGYTHWAYACAIRSDASTILIKTRVQGHRVYYEAVQAAASAVTAQTEQTTSVSAIIPPNALTMYLNSVCTATTTAGGLLDYIVDIRIVTGVNHIRCIFPPDSGLAASTTTRCSPFRAIEYPNLSQQIIWIQTLASGTSPSATINIFGYTIPNGDS